MNDQYYLYKLIEQNTILIFLKKSASVLST